MGKRGRVATNSLLVPLDLGFGAARDLAADPLAVLNARYGTSPAARTMPVMLWIAALAAMVEVDGIATAPTTALDLLWHTVSPTLRLPSYDLPNTDKPLTSRDGRIRTGGLLLPKQAR